MTAFGNAQQPAEETTAQLGELTAPDTARSTAGDDLAEGGLVGGGFDAPEAEVVSLGDASYTKMGAWL
ncbi:hypothetical protein [Streptomyces sp. YGL11-2]|uniref:hypothetical protein n=1 Tax=Streptomyces sp. YGL11-2 TaxID=3414028 RepID=UPI003CF8E2B5